MTSILDPDPRYSFGSLHHQKLFPSDLCTFPSPQDQLMSELAAELASARAQELEARSSTTAAFEKIAELSGDTAALRQALEASQREKAELAQKNRAAHARAEEMEQQSATKILEAELQVRRAGACSCLPEVASGLCPFLPSVGSQVVYLLPCLSAGDQCRARLQGKAAAARLQGSADRAQDHRPGGRAEGLPRDREAGGAAGRGCGAAGGF